MTEYTETVSALSRAARENRAQDIKARRVTFETGGEELSEKLCPSPFNQPPSRARGPIELTRVREGSILSR